MRGIDVLLFSLSDLIKVSWVRSDNPFPRMGVVRASALQGLNLLYPKTLPWHLEPHQSTESVTPGSLGFAS